MGRGLQTGWSEAVSPHTAAESMTGMLYQYICIAVLQIATPGVHSRHSSSSPHSSSLLTACCGAITVSYLRPSDPWSSSCPVGGCIYTRTGERASAHPLLLKLHRDSASRHRYNPANTAIFATTSWVYLQVCHHHPLSFFIIKGSQLAS